jgi:hypothetical protein
VIEQTPSTQSAPYFGVDIQTFRSWLEVQFVTDIRWESFGQNWQLEHIIPTSYFDSENEDDRKLCWNFLNIKVSSPLITGQPDLISAKTWFQNLYSSTQYSVCLELLKKLESREAMLLTQQAKTFITDNIKRLNCLLSLDKDQLDRINRGETLEDIILENEILTKFGS